MSIQHDAADASDAERHDCVDLQSQVDKDCSADVSLILTSSAAVDADADDEGRGIHSSSGKEVENRAAPHEEQDDEGGLFSAGFVSFSSRNSLSTPPKLLTSVALFVFLVQRRRLL